jgi:hypothetical protein
MTKGSANVTLASTAGLRKGMRVVAKTMSDRTTKPFDSYALYIDEVVDATTIRLKDINAAWSSASADLTGVTLYVQTGMAQRLTLDGEKVVETKTWLGIEGASDAGSRTYVTQGGFVVARFPYIYFIDPDSTPEGLIPPENTLDLNFQNRICLASYIKNDKRYLLAAYGAGKFREFEISSSKPYKPIWSPLPPEQQISGVNFWGYSCHIDQKKKIFYAQWINLGPQKHPDGNVYGGAIDLNTMTKVELDPALNPNISKLIPNATFTTNVSALDPYAKGISGWMGSYAVAGDPDGNIYNADYYLEVLGPLNPPNPETRSIIPPSKGLQAIVGKTASENSRELNGTYTMAYDASTDTVWFNRGGNMKMGLIKRKCLTTESNCTTSDYILNLQPPPGSAIGPMSPLKDGRIAVLSVAGAPNSETGTYPSNGKASVWVMKVKDPANLAAGVDSVKVADIDGHPYMYVDFTGATLYTFESEQTFKITDIPGYSPMSTKDPAPRKLKEASFSWLNKSGTEAQWKDLRLEARCYLDPTSKPTYEEVKSVADVGSQTPITAATCKNIKANYIDIRITQIKGETLGDIKTIQVGIVQ